MAKQKNTSSAPAPTIPPDTNASAAAVSQEAPAVNMPAPTIPPDTSASAEAVSQEAPAVNMPAPSGPTRESLDRDLAALPGEYADADFVVNGMRSHFGELFTADDEATVRQLVGAPAAKTPSGATHRVNWELWTGPRRYREGDTIALSEDEAAKLGDVVTKL